MKAKDYALEYQRMLVDNHTEQQAISWLINSFMLELKDLTTKRGSKSISAGIACYNEINQKWLAFTNLVPGFRRDGLEQYVRHALPELWNTLCAMRLNNDMAEDARRGK